MIIDIKPGTFGGPMRNGDMIALLNVFEHLRRQNTDQELTFYMMPGTINEADYCVKFFEFLKEATDYFADEPSGNILPWNKINLWDYRDISGDLITIPNAMPVQQKIVVFPVFDAPYNTYRNWSPTLLQKIIDDNQDESFERIICAKELPPGIDLKGFTLSTDFMDNIHHIMDCHSFFGGETGTSIFASVLDRPPPNLMYFYSSRALLHTTPFHLLSGKGKMLTYWMNFEGTTWE